jgi:YD repeat-containing protein
MITTFTYDSANRLTQANAGGAMTTYSYDPAGNRIRMQTPTDSTYYSWDPVGRMATAEVAAGIVSFTYNADGQRVAKQGTDGSVTGFLYDHNNLLAETDEVGGDVSALYTTGTDQEFGDLIEENGGQAVPMFNAQANTNALLDSSGNVQAIGTKSYVPFNPH